MRRLLRILGHLLICTFAYLFILPFPAAAAGEFQADYDVQYAIAPNGNAIVTQNITLTNKQTNLYAQQYSIVLDTTKVKNIIAYDSKAIEKTDITQKDGKTQIILTFNDRVVGIGKQLQFTLRFDNGDIAQKNGNIWEVNIPGVVPDADINSYNVSLSVPDTFGSNAYMSPLPASGNRWTKSQMMAGGVSAAYGTSQSFDVSLSYFINNPTIGKVESDIALPPDTAFQTVIVKSLDPMPDTVVRDADGNWLAKYTLLPGGSKSIEAKLHINLFIHPKSGYEESVTDTKPYTNPLKYWESDNAKITALAKIYTTPREIYQYVVHTLNYDYKRVESSPIRKGAVQAIAAPENSICTEFTDLFIAIARAAGIPARESVGYAYTSNSKLRPLSLVADVLHAWPEYYDADKKIWIPVDPTWANTTGGVNYFDKLDFNHIVFAIQGVASDFPYPAGFYRKSGKVTKDVSVEFSTTPFTNPVGKLNPTFAFPTTVTAGLTSRGTLTIENTVGISIPTATVIVQSSPVDVAITDQLTYIPPFAKHVIPLAINVPNYLTTGKGRFLVSINGEVSQYPFDIQPITSYFIIPTISFSAILVILIALSIRRIHLWKKHHHKKR